MFNRTLQVKMVKAEKEIESPSQVDVTHEGKLAIAGFYINRIAEKIGGMMITYIAMDTIRQVLVARANRR